MADLNFPNAIFDEHDFYGRQDELETIRQKLLLRQRVPIFVVGERRIGKTSLQNVAIRQVLSDPGVRFRDYNIEPRGIASYSQFALAILRQLITGLNSATAAVISLPQAITTVDEFEYILRKILAFLENEVIICVDEFDVIIHKLGQERQMLMGMLYQIVEKTNLPVYFFFTVTSIPEEMKTELSSTLVSISEIIELKPLHLEEMSRLAQDVTQGRWIWSGAALEELFRLSGGHPYFTKLILACMPVQPSVSQPVMVTGDLLECAVQRAVQNPQANHVLSNLFSAHFSSDEKALLFFLAERGQPITTAELSSAGAYWMTQARYLKNRYYLQMPPPRTTYDFRIAFLGEWLRNWNEFDLQCELNAQLRKILCKPEIEVDEAAGVVYVCGQEVHLSVIEHKIMSCLAAKADQLVTRDELMEAAWDAYAGVSDQTIDNAIFRLRKRLNDQGKYIETKTGQGFILHRATLLNRKKEKNPA